jgi:hypothetical protein
MAYSQEYVNQLVSEAAAQAGGTLSYADVSNAAANLGIPASQVAAAFSTGVISAPSVEDVISQLSPGQAQNIGGVVYQPVYDSTGQGETFEQGPLKEVLVYKQGQQTGDAYNQYSPTGELVRQGQFKDTGDFGDLLKDMGVAIGPTALMALTAGGAGGLLGGLVAPTASAATQAALGGALLGGGGAAITGQDILKGAFLGGAGGYLSNALASGITDSQALQAAMDADIAGGMIPEFGTNAAYDSFMQSAMTPEAMSAIERMIAESSVAGMTPEQILAQGNVITDMASGNYMGPMTADELGNSFEKYMAEAGYLPTNVAATGVPTATGTVAGAATKAGTAAGLTPGKLLDAAKVAAIVAGATGAAKSGTPQSTGFNVVPVPNDWRAPAYTQAPYKPLPPIDFGSRKLLRGTQWEKYLNPVQPAAVQPVQMGMGYNQLMNTLQGGQGGNLTLNDIISGIQGQYGQTPSGTVR